MSVSQKSAGADTALRFIGVWRVSLTGLAPSGRLSACPMYDRRRAGRCRRTA